jgi:hypothetical protein
VRPLRDVSRRHPHTRGVPVPRFGPSLAFRTPSTVFAAAGLAGLFRPAAASRISLQGFVPHRGADRLSPIVCPRAVGPIRLRVRPAPENRSSTSGPCSPRRVRWPRRWFRPSKLRAPRGLSSFGCSPDPPWQRFRAASARGLRRIEPDARDPRRVAGEPMGWRGITLPTRSRFSA